MSPVIFHPLSLLEEIVYTTFIFTLLPKWGIFHHGAGKQEFAGAVAGNARKAGKAAAAQGL